MNTPSSCVPRLLDNACHSTFMLLFRKCLPWAMRCKFFIVIAYRHYYWPEAWDYGCGRVAKSTWLQGRGIGAMHHVQHRHGLNNEMCYLCNNLTIIATWSGVPALRQPFHHGIIGILLAFVHSPSLSEVHIFCFLCNGLSSSLTPSAWKTRAPATTAQQQHQSNKWAAIRDSSKQSRGNNISHSSATTAWTIRSTATTTSNSNSDSDNSSCSSNSTSNSQQQQATQKKQQQQV